MIISPSIASSNILYVADEVAFAERYCRQVHLDIEDGIAVQDISFGMKMCKKIKEIVSSDTYISLHLEVQNPLCYLEEIRSIEPDIVLVQTNHLENPLSVLQRFKEAGIHTGLSISDADMATNNLAPLLSISEQVLVLTASLTDPKQRFQMEFFQYAVKIAQKERIPVWVDGGITLELYKKIKQTKTPIYAVVMGRGVFGDKKKFLETIYWER